MIHRSACLSLLAAGFVLAVVPPGHAQTLPGVASINLCTDQLVLSVADPSQIRTLSWLSADPRESVLAEEAGRYDLNYGTAEEILRADPDVVVGGEYTSAFTRSLLAKLGFEVISVAPANSVADIERNLRQVAAAIGRSSHAEAVIADMRARIARIEHRRSDRPVTGIVVRPGGFTVGAGSLANELMQLAGLENIAAVHGLDAWGSLSLESLVTSQPELLIFTGYYRETPSLANSIFAHPLVGRVSHGVRVAEIDAPLWSCGIPESVRSAELLQLALHGSPK